MMGSVNYITTIINMRAPGMTLFRMPMTIWAMFITAILQAFALPVLTVGPDHAAARQDARHDFFLPPAGLTFGNCADRRRRRPAAALAAPVLVLLAPGRLHHDPAGDGHGLRHHLPTFSRKPLFGYKPMVYSHRRHRRAWASSSGATTCSSRGMNPRLGTGFMVATIMIALPVGHQGLQLAGHALGRQHPVHHGRCSSPWRSCRCSSSAACRGIFMAATPVDIYIHDTYFIVAHFHYVLFAGSIFGIFAAIYFWFPKMFGRMMNETLGQGPLLPDVHLLQRHVLPDAHHRRRRPAAPDLRPDAVRVPAARSSTGTCS